MKLTEIIIQGEYNAIEKSWFPVPVKLVFDEQNKLKEQYFQTLLSNMETDWWRVWDNWTIRFDKEIAKQALKKARGE